MLRRPTLATPSAPSAATGLLPRRGTHRIPDGGLRRRPTGRDVPVGAVDPASTGSGVVPRMRHPRGPAEEPATAPSVDGTEVDGTGADRARAAGPATLSTTIDRHLALLRRDLPPLRPEAVDDDRARCDPPTASFAALRPGEAPGAPTTSTVAARVATPGDRPRTAPFPAPVAD